MSKRLTEFTERFRILYWAENCNEKELGRCFRCDPIMIRRWRAGESFPNIYTLTQICKHFNVSADWLLGLSVEKRPPKKVK